MFELPLLLSCVRRSITSGMLTVVTAGRIVVVSCLFDKDTESRRLIAL